MCSGIAHVRGITVLAATHTFIHEWNEPSCISSHQMAPPERGSTVVHIQLQLTKVKYTSICIAHFYAKRLKCAQTWITQFYLQIAPRLPLLPSRRTSPPFGWYSFYHPTEGRSLSRPGWLVTYRNKVPPPGVEPGHSRPSQY